MIANGARAGFCLQDGWLLLGQANKAALGVGGRSNERTCGDYLSDANFAVWQLQRGKQCARRDGLWELVEEMGRGKGLL